MISGQRSVGASPRILVIRNDKLGDFMLAWPALALLRDALPTAHIAVLVPAYTAPLAEICTTVDQVIIDPRGRGVWRNGRTLGRLIRNSDFDAAIALFSRFDTGLGAWSAAIPYRLAPATKIAQIFYNRRARQRRSKSVKPEYEYNVDLVKVYLGDQGCGVVQMPPPPYLHFGEAEVSALEQDFRRAHGIPQARRLIFVHAGHGGSASNLSVAQYSNLIRCMQPHHGHHIVLTAGPGEEPQVDTLSGLIAEIPHCVYVSRHGLVEFAKHLQFCDIFISGSTGPLHIAAALNCRTAAFYPRKRSASALRWQTVNAVDRRLVISPPPGDGEEGLDAIDLARAAEEIRKCYGI